MTAPRSLPVRLALAATLTAALVLGTRGPAGAQPDDALGDAALADEDALVFQHVTGEDGLPSEAITDVTQDALGFIWIGTSEGLARWDGAEMRGYRRTADSTSLSGTVVQVVEPGVGGAVWVGTLTGLSRYDPARDAFVRIGGLPTDDVLSVEPDTLGGAWVGTTAGLARVEPDGTVSAVTAGAPSGPVGEALLTPDGTLWVGTDDGLVRRDAEGRFATFRPPADSVAGAFRVQSLALDERGGLLVGTFGSGLLSFAPSAERFTGLDIGDDPLAANVMDIHADGDGGIWVGTLGGGLRRIVPGAPGPSIYRSSAEDPASLSGNEVTALHEDRQGVLWVATYSGLDRFDRARGTAVRLRHNPEIPTSIADNDVRAVLKTDQMLYVGTDAGLDRSDDGERFAHHVFEDGGATYPVRALYQDRAGAVWIGTQGDGLHRLDDDAAAGPRPIQKTRLTSPGATSATGDLSVIAILEDSEGRFWVGTSSQGLALYDREAGDEVFYQPETGRMSSLSSLTVNALAEDADGDLWVGTDDGVCRLDQATDTGVFTCFRPDADDPTALMSGIVRALHARPDGSLWVGTNGGFHRLDVRDTDAGFTRYTPETSDLPGETVLAIVEDEDGRLWLSTNEGLTRFEPVDGTFYQRLDGSDAERSLTTAAGRAPDGQLYFGSTRGLLAFYPRRLSALNSTAPEVVITEVEVGGQTVDPDESDVLDVAAPVAERIELPPDQGFLTIHYAGLHFSDPAENTYRYRLVGEYDDWIEAEGDREATFTALPPGRYAFEVEAANADGVGFGDGGASIEVVVLPPWWRTWWALLIFAGLAVFGLVRADRWQRARLLRQERERAERRETELRAETAEAERRKATAEAAALKAENERKAAELERTRDVEAANAQLEASLKNLRETQNQLVQSEKLASLGQLTAGIAHEIKNPLNFVNNFADLSVELTDELREEMGEAPERPVGEVLAEVDDLLDDLKENCRRIKEHGQRADRIVRSMLLHSRGGSSERGRVDINKFVDEYANLAFHGARANDSDFQVEVVRDFDETAGEVEIVPQEFGRVLINLLTNAFHAVTERSRGDADGYVSTVTVRTVRSGDEVTVDIEDNGTGIPAAVKARIFEPFFTTKPTGEGTGLGLSLAHDIVTQVHGGRMAVESAEGEGTTFRVTLPAPNTAPAEAG